MRNQLIHHMANLPYDNEQVQKVAVDGNDLVRKVKNKTASVVNRLKKEKEQRKRRCEHKRRWTKNYSTRSPLL